jgi:predicted transcriptional regulator
MLRQYNLFDKPLQDLCRKVANIEVKDCMYTPRAGEYVQENNTLEVAVHQLVIGQHQSLLVTNGKDIVGIIRLVDVFKEVCNEIKACKI